jgi:hypothetical protein
MEGFWHFESNVQRRTKSNISKETSIELHKNI